MSTARALKFEPVPRLENGDVLSRDEFERRYEAMPGIKAELIHGVVYLASPVFKEHSQPHTLAIAWLGAFQGRAPDVEVLTEQSVRLGSDSEVQPDGLIRRKSGGTSHFAPDGYLEGAPELVMEIAATSVSRDLHMKLRAYQESGVREYIVWRVLDGLLDWFELVEGEYVRLSPDQDALYHSRVFPGLVLAVDSLLSGDIDDLLAVQLGLPRPD